MDRFKGSVQEGVVTSTLAGLGWMFDSFVINIYALALPFIARSFHAQPVALGVVASMFLLGYTVGTIGFGFVTDYLGRKVSLSISIAGYALITGLTALAGSIGLLGLMRFLTGVGGGGELPVAATFTSEMWPARNRGVGIGLMYVGYPLGYLLAIAAAALMIRPFGWRGVFAVAVVPGLLIWAVRRLLRESPRFEQVQRAMKQRAHARGRLQEVFASPVHRRHLLMGVLIYIPLTYCYYALSVFLPTYLQKTFHLSYGAVLGNLTILTVAYVVIVMLFSWLIDVVGRRPMAVVAAAVSVIGGLLMFSSHSLTTFMLVGVIAYPAWAGCTWTVGIAYVNELFPTEIRGSGFGLSVGAGRITSIFAPIISGLLSQGMGLAGAFEIAAAVWVLLIVGFLMGPETRRMSLEEIDLEEKRRLGATPLLETQ